MNLTAASLLALVVAGAEPAPPAELACLARHYAIRPVRERDAWLGELPDGSLVPFDDGKPKSFAERLAAPDLKDIFSIPYHPGAIGPVEREDDDPGRIRVTALLAATYGPRAAARQARVRFLGLPVRVHERIVPALLRVAARLATARQRDPALAPFLRRLAGGFAERTIAGTDRTSAHAFGIAIDLDKSMSDYWRWQKAKPLRWRNRIPPAIVDAFEAEGFIWGGRWYHYDTMHFEYRPEFDCDGNPGRSSQTLPRSGSGGQSPPAPTRTGEPATSDNPPL